MKIPGALRWKATGKTLGQGGQGTVVEVTDEMGDNTRFALKALAKGRPSAAYQRFGREIEAIRTLQHAGIIPIIDYSMEAAFPYYVMELPEGAQSLRKILRTPTNRFYGDAKRSVNLFISIVDALSACEKVKIVHRDLSPANVLVLPDDSIRLIDFGLCQSGNGATLTLVDEGIGTPNYIAPECESHSLVEPDIRADLYAAGKILWCAVSDGEAFAREEHAYGAGSMKSLFPLNPATWHLHHIFEKTVRRNQNDRWSHCSDAVTGARHILYLIDAGYPPVELLDQMCPICGFGLLQPFEQSHMVFHNPMKPGVTALQCTTCQFCMPRDTSKARAESRRRSALY